MTLDKLEGKKQQKIPAQHLKTIDKNKRALLNTQSRRKYGKKQY